MGNGGVCTTGRSVLVFFEVYAHYCLWALQGYALLEGLTTRHVEQTQGCNKYCGISLGQRLRY